LLFNLPALSDWPLLVAAFKPNNKFKVLEFHKEQKERERKITYELALLVLLGQS